MAASIPYFNAMFTNDMVESKQDEITVQGIEPRYAMFSYMYLCVGEAGVIWLFVCCLSLSHFSSVTLCICVTLHELY